MRFKPRPLTVGHKVPENAADVAASLNIRWEHNELTATSFGFLDGFTIEVDDSDSWVVCAHAFGRVGKMIATGGVGCGGQRAAVLALAEHLCEQRAPVVVPALCVECGLTKAEHDDEREFIAPVDSHARLVDAIAKAPTPDPRDVAKIVEKRAFEVGDRARYIGGVKGYVGEIIDVEWVGDGIVRGHDSSGRSWGCPINDIEHVDVEHAPAVAFEWDQGECFVDGFRLLVFGDGSWGIKSGSALGYVADCGWGTSDQRPARFYGKSREECLAMARAECEAAFLALPKR